MGLVLNEEQRLLRDSVREVFAERSPVSALRALRDADDPDGFSRELWSELAGLGFVGMDIDESHGGSAFGFQGLGIACEEAGRTLAATPLIATVVLGAEVVAALGDDEQAARVLPAVARGEHLLALAVDELPRHAPAVIRTRASTDGDGFRLHGRKLFVLDGHVADELVVVARTDGADDDAHGLSAFLVARDAPGVTVTRTRMVDSRNAAVVALDGVRVAGEALLGTVGGAGAAVERALDRGRIALAAEMLGGAQEAFDRTLAYLKMREQFGVVIGSFQALKHRAAHMFNALELTRSAVYAAASAVDDGADDVAALASLAKAQAADTFELVAGEGVQMHGGIGMTDDEEIGFFLKRARVTQQALGDATFHRDRYARLNGF